MLVWMQGNNGIQVKTMVKTFRSISNADHVARSLIVLEICKYTSWHSTSKKAIFRNNCKKQKQQRLRLVTVFLQYCWMCCLNCDNKRIATQLSTYYDIEIWYRNTSARMYAAYIVHKLKQFLKHLALSCSKFTVLLYLAYKMWHIYHKDVLRGSADWIVIDLCYPRALKNYNIFASDWFKQSQPDKRKNLTVRLLLSASCTRPAKFLRLCLPAVSG